MKLRAAAIAALISVAACSSPSNGREGTGASSVAVYPEGIQPFKSATAARDAGLYATYFMRGCCFIKQEAILTLDKPSGSRVATLHFFVPNVAPFKDGETVTVSVAGATASGQATAGKWLVVSLPLPAQFVGRTAVPVKIVAAKSFNPAKLGMNNDKRDFSVVLQRVDYP